jgi:hypothetical protein
MVQITAIGEVLKDGGAVEVRVTQAGVRMTVSKGDRLTSIAAVSADLTLLEVKALRKTLKWAQDEMKARGQ